MGYREIAEAVAMIVDALGVVVIVLAIVFATTRAGLRLYRHYEGSTYRALRQDIGHGILLGLEVLIAADIIRTVAVDPSVDSVVVLGGIVLVRTFLSFALEIELTGRLPWRRAEEAAGRHDAGVA